MYSERYVLKREVSTSYGGLVTTLIIFLRNMPEHTLSHADLKENILKYIDFVSAQRLEEGHWRACDDPNCTEKLFLTLDDIRTALQFF